MRLSWIAALGVLAGVSLALALPAQSRPKQAAAPAPDCKTDTDCVLVTDGCCGCTEGGKQRAIPAKAKANYERKRKALCRETLCPALMSEDASCIAGRAVCKEGQCALGS